MSEYPVPSLHRRARRSRAELLRIVSSYPKSGMNQSEFCRQHGLSLSTLNRHHQHASQRSSIRSTSVVRSATELSLAPVEFVQKPTVHREQHSPLLVELVGGRRIAVSSGFDAETLTRLIAVIEQA